MSRPSSQRSNTSAWYASSAIVRPTIAGSCAFRRLNWSGCIEMRRACFRANAPSAANRSVNTSRHAAVQTGCDANGTMPEPIRKARRPRATFQARTRSRQARFASTVASRRSSEYDASRKVRFAVQPIERLMHGYPIRMLERGVRRVYICRVIRDPAQPVCVDDQATLADGADDLKAFRRLLETEGPTDRAIALFRRTILDHYREFGRRMPWRETTDPYRVLVSEVMLQQTQVDRVRPKYAAFLEAFPDVASLARASPADVLRAWQGLGYNRRALALQAAAARIVAEFGGRVPEDPAVLETMPGIGPATAAAIAAYAFERPTVYIETNVRRVFLHFFFRDRTGVTDAELRPLVERALDRERPREWYWALMDYGTMLAKTTPNPNRRSAHHAVQSRFEGSARQLRGRVLKALLASGPLGAAELGAATGAGEDRLEPVLARLRKEGFVAEDGPIYRIPDGIATEHLK